MARCIVICILLISISSRDTFAQPPGLKEIPAPSSFIRSIGKNRFDPALLRSAIVNPISSIMVGFSLNPQKKDDDLTLPEIRKKLLGDERDAEWLHKLGERLNQTKSPDAKSFFTQSVAAYVKRIKKEPTVSKHFSDITRPLCQLDRMAEARACAKRSVELNPKNADGWWELVQYNFLDFLKAIYGKAPGQFIHGVTPPPELSSMSRSEKAKAIVYLKEIRFCIDQWKLCTRLDIVNVSECAGIETNWAIFDTYFQTGKWDRDKHVFQALQSKVLQEILQIHGRDNQDPFAYLFLAMTKIAAFAQDSKEPSWSPLKMTTEQKETLNDAIAPLGSLATHKDNAIVVRTLFVQTMIAHLSGEKQKATVHCERALSIAPTENAIITTMMQVVQKDMTDGFEKYWMDHAQRHPSAFLYLSLSGYAFYDKNYDRIDHLLQKAGEIDAKNRYILLTRAAVELKRGEASLAEAGRILDHLESRIDEPNPDLIIDIYPVPGFRSSYRYLRGIHTALKGDWEKGRRELMELRDLGLFEKGINDALEAFPQPSIALPLINLDHPLASVAPPSKQGNK